MNIMKLWNLNKILESEAGEATAVLMNQAGYNLEKVVGVWERPLEASRASLEKVKSRAGSRILGMISAKVRRDGRSTTVCN